MLAHIIDWSGRNRFLVLLATLFITVWGIFAVLRTPIDALPDLSDVQVIVYTEYSGPGAAGGGRPGDLPADHRHAVGAEVQGGARLLVLWRVVCLYHL
jgi:hypothetical protein